MASRKVTRFSLASLLCLITLVALVFGYAKWKYESTRSKYQQLEADGVELTYAEANTTWLEFLAIGKSKVVKPIKATVVAWRVDKDILQIGDQTYQFQEKAQRTKMSLRMRELNSQARKLGLETPSDSSQYEWAFKENKN
jgi:hypothetical protein